MINKITLDNKEFQFNESLLPCFVVGEPKSGASYLSICLISNLIQTGSRVIFFTAFPMAKEELLKQISGKDIFEVTSEEDITDIPQDMSILVQSGNVKLWQMVIKNVGVLDDYVIFIKNIEEYDQSIIETIGNHKKVILSGNIMACTYKNVVITKDWLTRIIFNATDFQDIAKIPALEKYESYLTGQKQCGILRLIDN